MSITFPEFRRYLRVKIMNKNIRRLMVPCFVLFLFYWVAFYMIYIRNTVEDLSRHVPLNSTFTLQHFSLDSSGGSGRNIYFIEVSGRSFLLPRQVCAIESASSHSGLKTVVFMTSKFWDMRDETNRQLFYNKNVNVFTLDPEVVMEGLPTYDLLPKLTSSQSMFKIYWFTDLVRVAVLYKLGGIYSDLDVIILKHLDDLQNSIFIDEEIARHFNKIPNALLSFEQNSKFLWLTMETQLLLWNEWGDKTLLGPNSLYQAYEKYRNLQNKTGYTLNVYKASVIYSKNTGLSSKISNPLLFPNKPQTDTYWKSTIGSSRLIHFLSNTSNKFKVDKNDTNKTNAYTAYAPKFCPKAFYSATTF